MKPLYSSVFVAVLLFITTAATAESDSKNAGTASDQVVTNPQSLNANMNSIMDATDAQISEAEPDALNGDGQAAMALSNTFVFKRDDKKSLYWLQIAAENGNVIGERTFGMALHKQSLTDPDPKDRARILERAIYWLTQAEKNGDLNMHYECKEFIADIQKELKVISAK